MDYVTIEFLEMTLDITSMIFCIVAGVALLMLKRHKGVIKINESDKDALAYQQEMLLHCLKQWGTALDTISGTIEKERIALQNIIENQTDDATTSLHRKLTSKDDPRLQRKKKGASTTGQYGEVKRMGELGLSVREIAKKVKMGRAEVELALQLNKMGTCSRGTE